MHLYTIGGDALDYINAIPIRSPIYPLLIKIFGLNGTVIIQTLLLVFSAWLLQKKFGKWSLLPLLLPLWGAIPFFNFYIPNCREIMTETLALAIFYFTLYAVMSVQHIKASVFAALNLLVRSQMVFVIAAYGLYLIFLTKEPLRRRIKLIAILALCTAGAMLCDMTYHKIAHGRFKMTSMANMDFAAETLYFAGKDKVSQQISPELAQSLDDDQMYASYRNKVQYYTENMSYKEHMQKKTSPLLFQKMIPFARKQHPELDETAFWYYMDRWSAEINSRLWDNKSLFKATSIKLFYYFFPYPALLLILLWRRERLTVLLCLMNALTIAPILDFWFRFMIYTDILLMCCVLKFMLPPERTE
jgi:hypothetical protein